MGTRTPGLPVGHLLKCITVVLASDAVVPVPLGDIDSFEVEVDEGSAGPVFLITADAAEATAAEHYPIAVGRSRLIVANNPTIKLKRSGGQEATVRVWRYGQPAS